MGSLSFIVDKGGRVTGLNPLGVHLISTQDLIGTKEEACLGQSLVNVVRFIDPQGRPMDQLAEGFSQDLDTIVSLVRQDDHITLVDGAVSPVPDRHKCPSAWL